MTELSPFERAVADWLGADAPARAPAEVLPTALERAAARGQDRYVAQRLFGDRYGRSPALRAAIVVVLVATAMAAAAALVGSRVAPAPRGIGAFQPGPSLLVGREYHTTTLLSDGRVLVLGGQTHPDVWIAADDSTEWWDPEDGDGSIFTRGEPLLEARSRHTATLLPDGRVLVVGGDWWDGAQLVIRASAEVWDPATETFSPAGTLAHARFDHTATLLPDGRVLIAGGDGGVEPDIGQLASLEIWDPVASRFDPAGQLHTARSGHTALLLADGQVLVVGDMDTELWDPSTGEVTRGPALVDPRYFHAATLLQDGRVLVTGGMWGSDADIVMRTSAEVWDPGAAAFTLIGNDRLPRASHTATLLADGRVLVAGGDDARTAETWDPRTGTFAATGPTMEARNGATATLLKDGRVLLVGAMSRQGIPTLGEIWDPGARPVPRTATPTPDGPSTPQPVKDAGG